MESRRLLTTIAEHSLIPAENADSAPLGLTAGPDGNLWFADTGTSTIGRISPDGQHISIFSSGLTAGSQPQGITAGPDGNLWFTETVATKIGMITTTGQITEFSQGLSAASQPVGITLGPDGNLWFTEYASNKIGRINPYTHQIMEFSQGLSAGAFPYQITAGPDGNLWFTEYFGNRIGRITPSGQITEFSQGLSAGAHPSGITTGSDGNVWFTEYQIGTSHGRIGKVTPTGQITEFPTSIAGNSNYIIPSITAGGDGNLWFTLGGDTSQGAVDQIGMISPNDPTHPTALNTTATANPMGIASGPDGNVWFTETTFPFQGSNGGAIGVATLDSHLNTFVSVEPPTSVAPGGGFGLTAEIRDRLGALDTNFNGNVTITLSNNPGGSALSGTVVVPAHNGVATFTGLALNNVANGYTLRVSASGPVATTTTPISVTPTPTTPTPTTPTPTTPTPTPPPTVTSEHVVLTYLRHNKKGKPIGKPVMSFVFQFDTAMNPGTADNANNYQVAWTSIKKVKKKTVSVLHPIAVRLVNYSVPANSVTVTTSATKKTFAKGGKFTIIASPPGGVSSATGEFLAGTTVFTIFAQAGGIS
jgi:streptogramin lyase